MTTTLNFVVAITAQFESKARVNVAIFMLSIRTHLTRLLVELVKQIPAPSFKVLM
jgi:hypothetical protein